MSRRPRVYASHSLMVVRLTSALLISIFCLSVHAQESGQDVTATARTVVGVGKAVTINLTDVVQVDIADGSIVGVYQYTERGLVVTGKKLGVTTIVLWQRTKTTVSPYTLEVRVDTTPTLSSLAEQLTNFINSNFKDYIKKEVKVTPSPGMDKVVVSGKVKNKKIADAILSTVESYQLPSSSIVDNLRVD